MVKLGSLVALWGIGSTYASTLCHGKCPVADVSAIAHTGTPVGCEEVQNGITTYVTGKKSKTAVLYLTDVFGIQLAENKLLADSFGRAGYLTVAPDLFNGTPAPADINGSPGFNTTEFLYEHRPEVTDPLIASTIAYMRDTLGVETIAATGYCYGGRYAFRVLAEGKGGDLAFAAHPSLLGLDEVAAITGPASVAAGELDNLMNTTARHALEEALLATNQPTSMATYSDAPHGFAVRANLSEARQKFAKEEAFFQAVRFFDSWA